MGKVQGAERRVGWLEQRKQGPRWNVTEEEGIISSCRASLATAKSLDITLKAMRKPEGFYSGGRNF